MHATKQDRQDQLLSPDQFRCFLLKRVQLNSKPYYAETEQFSQLTLLAWAKQKTQLSYLVIFPFLRMLLLHGSETTFAQNRRVGIASCPAPVLNPRA